MIFLIMTIASYTNDDDCHHHDDCIVHKWWWSSSSWWSHCTQMMMIVIIMMIASYTNDDDRHHHDDCIVYKWWWLSSWSSLHYTQRMMIVIMMMIASYTNDDDLTLYEATNFVTDERTDKAILGVGLHDLRTFVVICCHWDFNTFCHGLGLKNEFQQSFCFSFKCIWLTDNMLFKIWCQTKYPKSWIWQEMKILT